MNWSRQDTRALIEAAVERPVMAKWVVQVIRRHHGEVGLVEKLARLEEFLLTVPPHIWGVSDCSLAIADWAVANGHEDGAADLRGAYATEAECKALLAARGGLVAVVGACAAQLGLTPLHEPELGCIAVIGAPDRPDRQWAAIWSGHRWLVKWGDERSASWVPFAASPLALWRI